MAAVSSDSKRSVTPERAECTTTGRSFAAMRSRTTPAMLCQLEAEETLVPPNLRTTQPSLLSNTDMNSQVEVPGGRSRTVNSVVFEYVFEFFLELPLGKDILDPAPGRFTAFTGRGGLRPTLRALNQRIEIMRLFGFAEKLIVDIEMFVFAFHCREKPLKSIGSITQMDEVAHYSRFSLHFN